MGNNYNICLNYIAYKREKKYKPILLTLRLQSPVMSYLPAFFPQYSNTWKILAIETESKDLKPCGFFIIIFCSFLNKFNNLLEEIIKNRTQFSKDFNVFLCKGKR